MKTFTIKEPRSPAIAPTLKYARLNYYEKLGFWFNPVWEGVMNKEIKLFSIDKGIRK